MNYWFHVNLGGADVFFVQPINADVAPHSKKKKKLCAKEEKLFQYWYLALKISQYFLSIYWFCSKGFITLLIIAWKRKQSSYRPMSRIRRNIMEKWLLLGPICEKGIYSSTSSGSAPSEPYSTIR